MRTRLGAHLAALIAAAGFPMTLEDLARLTGRRRAQLAEVMPESACPGIGIDERGFALTGPDAVAQVVRGLHHGPLAEGLEHRSDVRVRALAPFRAQLVAAAESARTEWGWAHAAPFLLGSDFPRSMQGHPGERAALISLVTDAARQRALIAIHPDRAQEQLDATARHLADRASTPGDLVDLARVLVSGDRTHPVDGAPPHGLAPVWAFCGDLERATAIAATVRVEKDIESAYVGEAAARAGLAEGGEIARAAAESVTERKAAAGALLRVAQAVAGTALHLADAAASRDLAGEARRLVDAAFAGPEPIAALAGLTHRVFSGARDNERAIAATTLATVATAYAGAARDAAPALEAAEAAAAFAEQIENQAQRAVTLARVAMRLRVSTSVSTTRPGALDERSGALAAHAVETAEGDAATLADIARRLAATDEPSAADPDIPSVGDPAHAEQAAALALSAIAAQGDLPPRGALRDVALAKSEISRGGVAVATVHGVLAQIGSSRHATPLERATRSRQEAVVAAEAAVILARGGRDDEAVAAAHQSLEIAGRVPTAGRARPLAEIAAVLLSAPTDELFALGVQAADAERRGTAPYWDPEAAEIVAAAASTARGGAHGSRAAHLGAVFDESIVALRRHEYTLGLMRMADLNARAGHLTRAARIAEAARLSAHAADPVLRARARAALAASDTATPLDVRNTAESWLRSGYPLQDLAALKSADPRAAARVSALITADLDR